MVPCGASHFQHVKHIVTQLLFLVCSLMQFCYNFFIIIPMSLLDLPYQYSLRMNLSRASSYDEAINF
jgi:hypothetical protein